MPSRSRSRSPKRRSSPSFIRALWTVGKTSAKVSLALVGLALSMGITNRTELDEFKNLFWRKFQEHNEGEGLESSVKKAARFAYAGVRGVYETSGISREKRRLRRTYAAREELKELGER